MASAEQLAGQFELLYFAAAASYTKKKSETLSAPVPVSRLFDILEERYPGMKGKVLSSCAVTINLEYVDLEQDERDGTSRTIQNGDEVAIIPPVSSG